LLHTQNKTCLICKRILFHWLTYSVMLTFSASLYYVYITQMTSGQNICIGMCMWWMLLTTRLSERQTLTVLVMFPRYMYNLDIEWTDNKISNKYNAGIYLDSYTALEIIRCTWQLVQYDLSNMSTLPNISLYCTVWITKNVNHTNINQISLWS
jgi:hypothetical protein